MNYWQKRNLNSMRRVSRKSEKEINAQLSKYYQSAFKKVLREFEATYDKILATAKSGREITPADLYKLDKYWQMQGQIQQELQKLGDNSTALLQRKFIAQYKDVYKSLALPSGEAFGTIDDTMARQMINSIWCADGKSWSQRVWNNIQLLSETLNEELLHCVVSGKTTRDLKNLLQERFNVSYSNANRIVTTEIAHIQTQAAQQRYKDYGIKEVEMWADEDERRCDVCGKLHQKRYPIDAQMPVPQHPFVGVA